MHEHSVLPVYKFLIRDRYVNVCGRSQPADYPETCLETIL